MHYDLIRRPVKTELSCSSSFGDMYKTIVSNMDMAGSDIFTIRTLLWDKVSDYYPRLLL